MNFFSIGLAKHAKIYIELMRPFTLVAPLVGFLSGAIIAKKGFPPPISFLGAICACILNAASNVNNQYFDQEIDKINKPYRPLPSGKISNKEAIIFALVLYLIASILAYLVNIQFFVIAILAGLITFFYSAPPIRFKRHTILSNFAIAIPRGVLLIVAGWASVRPVFSIEPWFVGGIFALFILGAATTKDFADMEGDSKFGINTLPIIFGIEKTAKIISPFFVVPFLLIPLGVYYKIIRFTTLPLAGLAVWGIYVNWLILRRPQELTLEQNHISWKHMYFMLIAGQAGFSIAYMV
ncbi:MAG: UbiA prenyltransferase family protein [Candidatus Omnitrophica bacterium]|nr:UbiA prenyltransferase family protein [Candidatus Omnitrophota bacterium]